MSLRDQISQAQSDIQRAQEDAKLKKLSDQFGAFADSLPATLRKLAATKKAQATQDKSLGAQFLKITAGSKKREQLHLGRLEKWFHSTGKSTWFYDPEGLEKLDGYRRLREYCALPQVDVAFNIYVTGTDDASLKVAVLPLSSFGSSELTVHRDRERWQMSAPKSRDFKIAEFLKENADALAPPQVEPKISVMAPLKLKG